MKTMESWLVTYLAHRVRHLKKTLDKLWKCWKREYYLELQERHHFSKPPRVDTHPIGKGDLVTVYNDSHPWVQDLNKSCDHEV